MMLETSVGQSVDSEIVQTYLSQLVNKVFKILPMIENNEQTVVQYLESLEAELIGNANIIYALDKDPLYLSIIGTLEWLHLNAYNNEYSFKRKRREIFNIISMCKKIESHYTDKLSSDKAGE